MEGGGGMNDDRQAVEAVARTLHEWYGGYSDESATDDARNLLAVVRDAGWQPAPTEAEVKAEALEEAADSVRRSDWYTSWKVDNYAGTIRHWLRARADRLREGQQ